MAFWLSLAAVAGLVLPQQEPPARDWAATLRTDATAVHDAIADSHPGMVNPGDPHFARTNDAQYALALERAGQADSFADYFYAIQHYVAAFDDGHLGFGVSGSTPDSDVRWPGFVAQDDGARGLVVTAAEPWSGVPVGARILECDGRTAFEVGDDRMGARFGRWDLAAQRAQLANMVMLDTGDPYVSPLRQCVFDTPDGRRTIDLDWRDGGRDFYTRHNLFSMPPARSVDLRRLDDESWWVTLPTFDGNPEGERGRALRAVVQRIEVEADAMREAPRIVFDLRGNGGGSSGWSREIAEILWGEGAFARAPEAPMTVVWRASEDNLRSLRDSLATRDANGALTADMRNWYRNTIAGLEAARARGEDRWVIEPGPREPSDPRAARLASAARQGLRPDRRDLHVRLSRRRRPVDPLRCNPRRTRDRRRHRLHGGPQGPYAQRPRLHVPAHEIL
ncbi:MAG: hypothetical protein REJ23_03715 [Brevundimonas sp.]|nr:hypothetical protein [Brevundimonas sp.]